MKYRNKKTIYSGTSYSSKKEAKRAFELEMLQKAGIISGLQKQVPFLFEHNGVKICKYICDFQYTQDGKLITEDVKGFKTDVYRIKKKLLKAFYNIDILET